MIAVVGDCDLRPDGAEPALCKNRPAKFAVSVTAAAAAAAAAASFARSKRERGRTFIIHEISLEDGNGDNYGEAPTFHRSRLLRGAMPPRAICGR